jgi:hypothetical protein
VTAGSHLGGTFTLSYCSLTTALTGTFTATNAGHKVQTTSDISGVLAVGDTIKIGGFIREVGSVDATSITMNAAYHGSTATGLLGYRCATQTTSPIAYNAAASSVKAALEGLAGFTAVTVVREGPTANDGYTYNATFNSVPGDMPLLVADITSLTGKDRAVAASTLTDGSAAVGGSFMLSFAGQHFESTQTTGAIAYDATESQMETALQALSNVGTVNVTRTGPSIEGGYTWTVTYLTDPGDLPEISPSSSALLSGLGATVLTSTQANGTAPLGGTFSVGFTHGGATFTTSLLAYDANAATIKSALELLDNVGTVRVTRAAADAQGGHTWTVTFMSNSGDVPMLALGASQLTGNGQGVSFAETTAGSTVQEVQRLTLSSDSVLTSGTFKISITSAGSTQTTNQLSYDTSAANVKTAISGLSNVGYVDVARTQAGNSIMFDVTFITDRRNFADMVPSWNGGAGANVCADCTTFSSSFAGGNQMAVSETQAGSADIGGTFTLSYCSLSSVMSGTVDVVAGSNVVTTSSDLTGVLSRGDYLKIAGYTLQVAQTGAFDATSLPLKANFAGPEDASGLVSYKCDTQTTSAIAYDATAATVKSSIEALSNVGTVSVARSVNTINDEFVWTVTFSTNVGNLMPMVPDYALFEGTICDDPPRRILVSRRKSLEIWWSVFLVLISKSVRGRGCPRLLLFYLTMAGYTSTARTSTKELEAGFFVTLEHF